MRHAAAGNALTLKTATSASHHSHTYAAQPAAVGMSRQSSPRVAATDCWADGPARCSLCWTPVSATPTTGGQHRADTKTRHTLQRAEGVSANPQAHSRGNHPGRIPHGGIFALQGGEEVKPRFRDRVYTT